MKGRYLNQSRDNPSDDSTAPARTTPGGGTGRQPAASPSLPGRYVFGSEHLHYPTSEESFRE